MPRLKYKQIEPLLSASYKQLTGRDNIASLSYNDYISFFNTTAITNADYLMGVLETLVAKTIYRMTPYTSKMKGMDYSVSEYGDVIRKITPISDSQARDSDRWKLDEEWEKETPDWGCCTEPVKPNTLVTRTASGYTYSQKYTEYLNRMQESFSNQAGVEQFFSMFMQERLNQRELNKETEKLKLLANAIIGLSSSTGKNHIKALTEYNAFTGLSLTAQTVMQGENFRNFIIWLSAKIDNTRELMARKTTLFHRNFYGKNVDRMTPLGSQMVYLSDFFSQYFEKATANIIHKDGIEISNFETIPFWQSAESPNSVEGKARVLKENGTFETTASTKVDNIIGLIFDKEAMGTCEMPTRVMSEPLNARFGYKNTWYHYDIRNMFDWTENIVLITLD